MAKGLLVDFGGVLTTDVFVAFQEFCTAEGLPPDTVRDRFMQDPAARGLLADLETGKLTEAEFERPFAEVLGVSPDGLVDRLFGGMHPDPEMIEAVRAARAAGLRTGLLSNSWGTALYPHDRLRSLFDVSVISGEVGLRKPDPAIFTLTMQRLGVEAGQSVFVEDLDKNIVVAEAAGIAGVLHRDAETTIPRLESLLGLEAGALTP